MQEEQVETTGGRVLKTASHIFMAGVMLMFFVGVALGVYATIFLAEPIKTTLNYIMELARIVAWGYFGKAFGENSAKIIMSFLVKIRSIKMAVPQEKTESEGDAAG